MKSVSIPRLELLGNLLAARLVDSIKTALEKEMKFDEIFYWSHFLITLFWIKSFEKEFEIAAFIRRKLETSKIDCGDKIQKKPCLFTFSSGKQAMTANGSALLLYAMIILAQKLTQVMESNTAGFLRIRDAIGKH